VSDRDPPEERESAPAETRATKPAPAAVANLEAALEKAAPDVFKTLSPDQRRELVRGLARVERSITFSQVRMSPVPPPEILTGYNAAFAGTFILGQRSQQKSLDRKAPPAPKPGLGKALLDEGSNEEP
jgi:hypothetical protein